MGVVFHGRYILSRKAAAEPLRASRKRVSPPKIHQDFPANASVNVIAIGTVKLNVNAASGGAPEREGFLRERFSHDLQALVHLLPRDDQGRQQTHAGARGQHQEAVFDEAARDVLVGKAVLDLDAAHQP